MKEQKDYWPCCCVRRDSSRQMTHVKMHRRSVGQCGRCGATRPEWEEHVKREEHVKAIEGVKVDE